MSYTLHTKIETDADTKGIEQYDKKLKQVEKTGTSLGEVLKGLGRGLFAGAAISGAIRLAEVYGEVSSIVESNANRIGVSVENMRESLRKGASETHEDFFVFTKLVNSTSLAIQGFNGDMSMSVDVAKSLSAALKLSGTTAAKSNMVLEATAKMFASGEVSGRAFLGLAVEAPVLMDKLTKTFGMSAKEMKIALENETISMEKLLTVVGSFSDEFVAGVKTGPMNFSHFMTHIKNEFMYFFGEIEEGTRILSATFKTVVMLLQSITGTIRFLVKAVGGWNNAMKVLITLFVFLKRDVIFLKAQQLGSYFYKVAAGCMASSKGLIAVTRGLFTARTAAMAFWSALSLGLSVGVALFMEEFIAMTEGRPNLIEFGIWLIKDSVFSALTAMYDILASICQKAMILINPLMSGVSMVGNVIGRAASLIGFGRGKKTEEPTPVPSIVPQTQTTNPKDEKSVVNNNNQQIKIEIKAGENMEEVKQAVVEGVLEASNMPQVDTDKLEQRTKTQ